MGAVKTHLPPFEESTTPVNESKKTVRTGFLKGRISIPDDFDQMREDEIADMFT
jgi:hypothetical protein